MLNPKEKKILMEMQSGFPLVSRPYAEMAGRFGMREDELLKTIRRMRKKSIIRYAGINFNLKKLGARSTLVGMRIPRGNISQAAKIVSGYPEVSHNYLRSDTYNLWFTLSAGSVKRISGLIREIKKKTGAADVLDLRTRRVFKINTVFKLPELT